MSLNSNHLALAVRDVHKSYGSLKVLKGISLEAAKGDVVSIIGSSGSGKSTFLRCINFLEIPDQGSFRVNGEDTVLGWVSGACITGHRWLTPC